MTQTQGNKYLLRVLANNLLVLCGHRWFYFAYYIAAEKDFLLKINGIVKIRNIVMIVVVWLGAKEQTNQK